MNDKIIEKLKKDSGNSSYIVYRKKKIKNVKVDIIYNETLCDSDKLSDFILRSLTNIEKIYDEKEPLYDIIKNNISNIKIKEVKNYEDVCTYLNNGFVILLIENDYSLALEVKKNLSRSIDKPMTETSLRGAMDSFTENIETNVGLIKRRLKNNSVWNKDLEIGKYTKNKVSILWINDIAQKDTVSYIEKTLNSIQIDGIIESGTLKNIIEKEDKSVFPTILTTERPDRVCHSLLNGKIVILVDNSPFALVVPTFLNDFFLSEEDRYFKAKNNTLTRILRYTAFIITLLTPGLYIAITTFNQEMLPLELLTSFSSQRSSVPFPAFFEAFLMIISFEILRESDLRIPNFANSALSIVGALILGEAAVNAGIVSPIMIIIVSITAISALLFTEPEIINSIRCYRILFMIGGTIMGVFGVFIVFIYFIINISSLNSFGKPYLIPYTPLSIAGLKNSIVKFPIRARKQRNKYLTNNITKEVINEKD